MKIKFAHNYDDIISVENLLEAWKEFIVDKKSRQDVQRFQLNLMSNIISLCNELNARAYKHSAYKPFGISDPKPRKIHKASVRDRLLHHAIYRQLYPFFDRTFISDSFSCRIGKGTHKAINRFRNFAYKVSQNHMLTCWILKCDIRKFFENIDHKTLLNIFENYIPDKDIIWLLKEVISSFNVKPRVGLPLGNLTSQLFVNIYMNEFDQFVKHKLKARYYIRYADDFVIMSQDREELKEIISEIKDFLHNKLHLRLHPNKVSISTLFSGVDFLGWVNFPDHRVLRTATKRRMFKRLVDNIKSESAQSYLGLLGHGNAKILVNKISLVIEGNIHRAQN